MKTDGHYGVHHLGVRSRGVRGCAPRPTRVLATLLLGTAIALLTAGCGTSSMDVGSGASARTSPVSNPQTAVYRVPSEAMEPTLPIGTKVVVEKRPPTVGAIAVYHPPEGAEQHECGPMPHVLKPGGAACDAPIPHESETVEMVRRIVAGPGDEIYIRAGHVYRKPNGSGRFIRERDSYTRGCGPSPACDFPVPIKIPAGHWFLMGDNRGASDDSRSWGPVPTAWLVGIAVSSIPRAHTRAMTHPPKRKSFHSLAVAKIAACLRKAGVNVPSSDSALLSSTSGIKTRDPRIKAIIGKCRSDV
jgi:signal peptidase I